MTKPATLTESQQTLFQTLGVVPLELSNKYFIHLNDDEISYVITQGDAYVFSWLIKDGKPTDTRHYICTLTAGDIALSAPDYSPGESSQSSYGFYLALDHNTHLSKIKTETLFASQDRRVAKIISHYLDSISTIADIQTTKKSYQLGYAIDKNIKGGTCHPVDSSLKASDDAKLMWVRIYKKEDESSADDILTKLDTLVPVTTKIHVDQGEDFLFDSVDAYTVLENKSLKPLVTQFDEWLKRTSHQYFLDKNAEQKDVFHRLRKEQKNHLSNTFYRLYNSYKGNANITPVELVIDESLGMNRLMNEICKITDILPTLGNYQLFEKLDYQNRQDVERALSIQGFTSREVVLEEKWYKKNRWLIISKLKENNETILLDHRKNSYYYYDFKSNIWHKLTSEIANNIDNQALMIYRPLPSEPIDSGLSLFKRGIFFAHQDLRQILFTGLLISLVHLVTPVIIGRLLAGALPSYDIAAIHAYLLALLATTISVLVFQLSNSIAILRLESKFSLDIHAAIWIRLLKLPLDFFSKFSVGDLANRANIMDDVRGIWSAATTSAIISGLSMITTFGLLFYYSWQLALISIAFLVIIGIGVFFFIRSILPILRNIYDYRGKLGGIVFQLLNGIHKLRIAAKENTVLSLWSNVYDRLVISNRKFMLYNATLQSIIQIMPLLINVAIFSFIYYGLYKKGYNTNFSLGDFISFNAALGQLMSAFLSISSILITVLATVPMINRIMPILKEAPEKEENRVVIRNFKGAIELSNIIFGYRKDTLPVLNNLSLKIKPGEYVAIVGKSGSGKSTIARLVMGFEHPESGVILIDDINTKELNFASLRSNIGVVLQNSSIIPGSILDNITVNDSDVTQDDVWLALEQAGMKKDVEKMPMTIHTIVTEGGSGLSGGQLQRLTIARALASKPSMLLFDEATSAMDNITQSIIQKTLEKMHITRIIIAHRLSTIRNVDRIYVLDEGKIIETGNYEELVAKKGYFQQLVERQQ